jgi:predicted glycoside hydrolase/deacetylase ChbG (UPF0249 family)
MDATRHLLVIADDFGIGPETTRGILDLACRGLVTGAVLLVNSPYAPAAVAAWQRSGKPLDVGWHPCLTLDSPVAPPASVASLVDYDGKLWSLAAFVRRLHNGKIRVQDVRTELLAQFRHFIDLLGRPPLLVNSHQHVALFAPVGNVLVDILKEAPGPVYVRAVREPWVLQWSIAGARAKRTLLNLYGRPAARQFSLAGFPSADWLAGLSNPREACRGDYFTRWLAHTPGTSVELMCHPGHLDPTLGGRDGTPVAGTQIWRADEFRRLADPAFSDECERSGFRRVRPAEWLDRRRRELTHAA